MRCLALCLFIPFLGVVSMARADVVDVYYQALSRRLNSDTVITDTGTMIVDVLSVERTLKITNMGVVNAGIVVGGNSELTIENYGDFNASFVLNDSAQLYQLITSSESITDINADVEYSVLVRGNEILNLNDIVAVAGDAKIIDLESVSLTLNGPLNGGDVGFSVSGNVTLRVTGLGSDTNEFVLLENVSGTGIVYVMIDSAAENPLFASAAYMRSGNLYVKYVRNTDYGNIMKNDIGRMLDLLRADNPGDSLLSGLDNANSMDEINAILSRSVRVNPIRLMWPILSMHKMNRMTMSDGDSIFARPFAIISDENTIYGARAGVAIGNQETFSVNVGLMAGMMDYESDVDMAKSVLYGGNVDVRYVFDDLFVRGAIGLTVSEFDVGPVVGADKIENNPTGYAYYVMADVGVEKSLGSDMYVSGFVGAESDSLNVAGYNLSDYSARIGGEIGYHFNVAGIEYKYSANVVLNTNSDIGAGARVAVRSVMDGVGGFVNVTAMRDEFGTHYEFSANAVLEF